MDRFEVRVVKRSEKWTIIQEGGYEEEDGKKEQRLAEPIPHVCSGGGGHLRGGASHQLLVHPETKVFDFVPSELWLPPVEPDGRIRDPFRRTLFMIERFLSTKYLEESKEEPEIGALATLEHLYARVVCQLWKLACFPQPVTSTKIPDFDEGMTQKGVSRTRITGIPKSKIVKESDKWRRKAGHVHAPFLGIDAREGKGDARWPAVSQPPPYLRRLSVRLRKMTKTMKKKRKKERCALLVGDSGTQQHGQNYTFSVTSSAKQLANVPNPTIPRILLSSQEGSLSWAKFTKRTHEELNSTGRQGLLRSSSKQDRLGQKINRAYPAPKALENRELNKFAQSKAEVSKSELQRERERERERRGNTDNGVSGCGTCGARGALKSRKRKRKRIEVG
ncbi:hypothetical protein WH47_06329 [Habropoda laboriosa]|uniref:Uncharacterized protein n=1 Tax=Habropoda laboriosa TaxID=597456 RepID=A0A0L7RCH4_9HYME|nr:hypothetical protein WH47_06329 [Habropoda laboriosa]